MQSSLVDGLPNFLVIGAMKAGTSSLYSYLRSHPQVFMPAVKEVDFFSLEHRWRKGWHWYARFFEEANSSHLAVGEASTSYTKFPHIVDVPRRISSRMPSVRLLYLIRNPIDRIRSHYSHRVAWGVEHLPIERAVIEDSKYVDFSRYALQIDQYLDHFPREQLMVVKSEDLRHQRQDTLRAIFAFLGLDNNWADPSIEQEFFRSDQRLTYPRSVLRLQLLLSHAAPRLTVAVAKRAPQAMKSFLGGKNAAAVQQAHARITEGLHANLVSLLRTDLERLSALLGESFDAWELLGPPSTLMESQNFDGPVSGSR